MISPRKATAIAERAIAYRSMRVCTRAVYDMETGACLEWEGYGYTGPIARCGGGPSAAQTNAANSQANLTNQLSNTFGQQEQFLQAQQNKVNPFYTQLMSQGSPYYANQTDAMSGNTAQAFAPAKQQLEKQLAQGNNALPSGFATQARTDLAANQARAFDQNLQTAQQQNLATRQAGAAGLLGQAQIANPTAYSGQALSGNQSIMNAPLASPGLGGLLGGLAGGALSAIPFIAWF